MAGAPLGDEARVSRHGEEVGEEGERAVESDLTDERYGRHHQHQRAVRVYVPADVVTAVEPRQRGRVACG